MGNWKYPELNSLFHALIQVETNLGGLATHLRDDILAKDGFGDRRSWYAPPADVAAKAGWQLNAHEVEWRKQQEGITSLWVDRADSFWTWCASVWDAISEARHAVLVAEPDLDEGIPNLLDKYSTKINQVLSHAEGSMNYRISLGWNPFRYPKTAPDEMLKAVQLVWDWVERLRPLAVQTGSPRSLDGGVAGSPAAEYQFRQDGDHFRVCFAGESGTFDGLDGYRYIRELLASPGTPIPALRLREAVTREQAAASRVRRAMSFDEAMATDARRGTAQADPVYDAEADAAIQKEIDETEENVRSVRASLEKARANGDESQAEMILTSELKPEMDKLQELKARRDADLNDRGKPRPLGLSDIDKARQAVGKAITTGVGRIGASMPNCGLHLRNSIPEAKDGEFVYRPESPVQWVLG